MLALLLLEGPLPKLRVRKPSILNLGEHRMHKPSVVSYCLPEKTR
jgi:hypothetical protein